MLIKIGALEISILFNRKNKILEKAIVNLLRGGHLVEAIKPHRINVGTSLKDSRDYVISVAKKHSISLPSYKPKI